jgi:hypothetical protein
MRRTVLVPRAVLLLCCCAFLISSGCSTKRDPSDLLAPNEVGTIVVQATLVVGQNFPKVTLSQTLSPDQPYDEDAAALSGADVRIFTGANGEIGYGEFESGTYLPVGGNIANRIQPHTEYRLVVRAADGRTVTATTTTPDSFSVRDWLLLEDPSLEIRRRLATFSDYPTQPDSLYFDPANQLIYQDGLLEARFDRVDAAAYVVGIESLDNGSPFVIDADFLSEEDLAQFQRLTSSPPLAADLSFLRLPWFAIFYEGRYRIRIYAVDRNWYDLVRSVPTLGGTNAGFGGNVGDAFERPIFHVEGGIGLFASGSMSEIGFMIHPKP